MAKKSKKTKEAKPVNPPEANPPISIAVNDTAALKDDLLYLVKLAISLTKEEPDISRYNAVARSLSALKTANDILHNDDNTRKDVTCISPATIALIEEEILGIKRQPMQNDLGQT